MLYEKCKLFEKLAISIQKNSNPLLEELSEIEDFDDRVEFGKKHFDFLGEGSSRTVFQMDEKLIIKIAHNEKGLQQNLVEMDPAAQTPCTNNAIIADATGKWIVFPFTENMKKEDFKKIVGVGFDQFMNALFYKFNNESDNWSPPRDYEKIETLPLFKCIASLIFNTDQQIGDIAKPSSFGIDGDKIVLRDIGLNRQVFDKYYRSSTSSSS